VNYKRYGVGTPGLRLGQVPRPLRSCEEPNEANRFGWVVEIDPFDPNFVPRKRTALGRTKHEGAAGIINADGRYVVYLGDDERFDYVYKFVTAGRVDRQNRAANLGLLDEGTLSSPSTTRTARALDAAWCRAKARSPRPTASAARPTC
jgi:secreted PhoX family phosphatase